MRGKKVQAIKQHTNTLALQFVRDRVLTEEDAKGVSDKRLLAVLPRRTLMLHKGVIRQAIGTYRYIYRQVKRNPSLTYDELIGIMYPQGVT